MIPRRDPETNPVLLGAQVLMWSPRDQYGAERRKGSPKSGTNAGRQVPKRRPVQTRNGLPVKHYRNWQTSRPSMTPDEAEAWLVYRYRSPGGTP